jgi:hypothetical protein
MNVLGQIIIGAFIIVTLYYLYILFFKDFGERHYDKYGKDFPASILSLFGKRVYVIIMKLFYISLLIFFIVTELKLC